MTPAICSVMRKEEKEDSTTFGAPKTPSVTLHDPLHPTGSWSLSYTVPHCNPYLTSTTDTLAPLSLTKPVSTPSCLHPNIAGEKDSPCGSQGLGGGDIRSYQFMVAEFQFGTMNKFWRRTVVMAVQQFEWT